MKKNIPDSDEWKKIVDEAFSSDEIHIFSENYKMKKQSMRKGIIMKRNNILMNLTVAAAAIAVVAFPTGIYLSTRTAETTPAAELPADEVETTSEDEVTIADETTEEFISQIQDTEVTITDGEDDGQVNEEIHQFIEDYIDYDTIYDLEYGWLPEGLEYNEDGPYAYKFKNVNNDRSGMTPSFTKFTDGVKVPHIVNCCKDTEEYTGDGKTVIISYRDNYEEDADNYNFGRVAYISFDNTPYTLSLWVTDDITKADLRKIIDNVKLVPSDTETAYIYTPYEEEDMNIANDVSDNQKVYRIGEEIDTVDEYGNKAKITVNDISFDTTVGDNNPQGACGISSELYVQLNDAGYVDENGSLTDNVRKYIQYSNGFDVEYQETEEIIPTQLLTVSMTYTNTGDTAIENIFNADNDFYLFTKRDGKYYDMYTVNMLDRFGTDNPELFNYKDTFDTLKIDDFHNFIYYTQNKNVLQPNESAEVKVSFMVEDEFMDNVYLDLIYGGVSECHHLVNVSISEKPE